MSLHNFLQPETFSRRKRRPTNTQFSEITIMALCNDDAMSEKFLCDNLGQKLMSNKGWKLY